MNSEKAFRQNTDCQSTTTRIKSRVQEAGHRAESQGWWGHTGHDKPRKGRGWSDSHLVLREVWHGLIYGLKASLQLQCDKQTKGGVEQERTPVRRPLEQSTLHEDYDNGQGWLRRGEDLSGCYSTQVGDRPWETPGKEKDLRVVRLEGSTRKTLRFGGPGDV